MENPKRQAWMYLVVGILAMIAGPWFLITDNGQSSFALLDWAILGMGVVAVYRGVRGFIDLKRSAPAASKPTDSGPRKIARPDASPTSEKSDGEG